MAKAPEETKKAKEVKSEEPVQPKLRVLSQYIRDMSFENIAAQQNRSDEVKPEITVQVNLDANKKSENSYEVILKVTINANAAKDPVFILEIDYGGRFHIENVPEEQLHPFLMIECPRMLFPYLRRVVGDITRDGGYPPLNLDNIDFLQLYRQEIMRRQAEATKKDS